MNNTTPSKSPRQQRSSMFFRDLASPISSSTKSHHHNHNPSSSSQAAAVSALWRDNPNTNTPPPPPVFTLDDRLDFSPEPNLLFITNSSPQEPQTPTPNSTTGGAHLNQQTPPPSGSSSWWSPHRDREKGSPVDGVVESRALIVLPPPKEVARPEMMGRKDAAANMNGNGGLDEEEWVTVYGFSPGDTNLVLREFEKCGVILKTIPGPREANWVHILYQNRYDAQKALAKNGMQLNSVLIIGVKPVDPVQRRYLNEKPNNTGFMVSLPPQSAAGRSSALTPAAASSRPNYLQNGISTANESSRRSTGAVASPAKSVVSKVMDLMFGY